MNTGRHGRTQGTLSNYLLFPQPVATCHLCAVKDWKHLLHALRQLGRNPSSSWLLLELQNKTPVLDPHALLWRSKHTPYNQLNILPSLSCPTLGWSTQTLFLELSLLRVVPVHCHPCASHPRLLHSVLWLRLYTSTLIPTLNLTHPSRSQLRIKWGVVILFWLQSTIKGMIYIKSQNSHTQLKQTFQEVVLTIVLTHSICNKYLVLITKFSTWFYSVSLKNKPPRLPVKMVV